MITLGDIMPSIEGHSLAEAFSALADLAHKEAEKCAEIIAWRRCRTAEELETAEQHVQGWLEIARRAKRLADDISLLEA